MYALKYISTLALLATITQAKQLNRPSIKDATITRSTSSCATCPENNCYKCTHGSDDTIRANTGGLAWVRSIVGFQLPAEVDPSSVTECTVQFPAFTKLPETGFNLTVVSAVSSDWEEAVVNGDNAPPTTDAIELIAVPKLTNPPLLDVTFACQNADERGEFSIYLGVEFGSWEIWSKDSGFPAVLHVIFDDDEEEEEE
ncbi:hypothetical protein BJY04DRAFT_62224 [Aspergillus karnatakaensis]|uniref:uncharacterized protein n=1 Tax=Aspergillus karnatakaensis TaxID=1810916 RepID=UPI003CCD2F67